MSLITDKVFYNAILSNQELVNKVSGRIESTAIPVPDKESANEPVPYILINFDGLRNEGLTKDSSYEGDTDTVTVSIEVDAETREELADIMQMIRTTVSGYFENADEDDDDYELVPLDYTFRASSVEYDAAKPCYYQRLVYDCDTTP